MGRPLSSRLALSLGMIVGIMFFLGRGFFGQEQSINWESVEIAARTYFDYPSTENARLFYLNLPEQPQWANIGNNDLDRFKRIIDFVFANLEVLARQASVGDRDAVRLGFRLYNLTGSSFNTLLLDSVMADLIRSQPQLFLEELKSSPNAQEIKTLGYPLLDAPLGFEVKRRMAYRYELEMRIKALESVTDSAVVDLRDACIKVIRDYLARYYHDLPRVVIGEKEYLPLFKKAAIHVYNQAEMANLVCQCTLELEEASKTGSFGVISGKIVHSSGLFDELAALRDKSRAMSDALENPPLVYTEEFPPYAKWWVRQACCAI